MKIRVTGFPAITTKEEIRRVFSEFGDIATVEMVCGKSIAYVTMSYDYQVLKAILSLDGTKILGRMIIVEGCFS